ARLAETFALEQRRSQEDFDRERRRTVRNNAEATGDIEGRTDLRQTQIERRAALRGVRPAGAVTTSGAAGQPLAVSLPPSGAEQQPQPITLRVQIAPTQVQIDGHTIVELTWPEFEQRVDTALASDLNIIVPAAQNQTAMGGSR